MDQQPPISIPFVAQRWQEENTNKATLTKNPSTSSSSFLSLKQQRHSRQRLTLRRWMNILPIRFFSFCIVIFCIPSGMFLEPHGERLSHEERRSMRNLFLKRFGLEPLADVISKGDVIRPHRRQPRSILSETNLPLPKYIWDIYEKHASGELPYETIRHFLPVSLQTIQENRLLLTYNLTAMGRNPEGVILIENYR
jgi:hypothetical protein